jgi:hypothetical protein
LSISAGTHTFGSGGTYATLAAIIADIAATLTGDLTLLQVGNSDDTGAFIQYRPSGVSGGAYTLKIKGNTPHYGSPLNGHWSKYGTFSLINLGQNTIFFEDFYGIRAGSGSGGGFGNNSSSTSIQHLRALNCLFSGFTSWRRSAPGGASNNNTLNLVNCKFWAPDIAVRLDMVASGDEGNRVVFQLENCVAYCTSAGSGVAALEYKSNLPLPAQHSPDALSFMKNCVLITPNSSIPAFRFDPNPASFPLSVFDMAFANNARSPSTNPYGIGGWDYTAISAPSDIISLDETLAGFLDLNHSSALFTAGTTPVLAGNPYSAPYPIGIWYPIPPSGIGGGSADSMVAAIPTAAGQGYMRPGKSRLMPWATGRLSHARILAAHRSPSEAAMLHNLIRGGA